MELILSKMFLASTLLTGVISNPATTELHEANTKVVEHKVYYLPKFLLRKEHKVLSYNQSEK